MTRHLTHSSAIIAAEFARQCYRVNADRARHLAECQRFGETRLDQFMSPPQPLWRIAQGVIAAIREARHCRDKFERKSLNREARHCVRRAELLKQLMGQTVN